MSDSENFDLWIERYAMLLGCDSKASTVSVVIQELVDKIQESDQYKRKYFAEIRKKARETKMTKKVSEKNENMIDKSAIGVLISTAEEVAKSIPGASSISVEYKGIKISFKRTDPIIGAQMGGFCLVGNTERKEK